MIHETGVSNVISSLESSPSPQTASKIRLLSPQCDMEVDVDVDAGSTRILYSLLI